MDATTTLFMVEAGGMFGLSAAISFTAISLVITLLVVTGIRRIFI